MNTPINVMLTEAQWKLVYSAVHNAKDYTLQEYHQDLEEIKKEIFDQVINVFHKFRN